VNRALGPMAWSYWVMVTCNIAIPQLLWFRRVRANVAAVFALSIVVNIGMWFERFVIIVTSLHRDFLPSAWSSYTPTVIEVMTLIGSFGLFFTCFLLFCRFVPVIAISEVKGVLSVGRQLNGDSHPTRSASAEAAPAGREVLEEKGVPA
jgi:molybdopterin-containing oxidoreductase family membrane subunit